MVVPELTTSRGAVDCVQGLPVTTSWSRSSNFSRAPSARMQATVAATSAPEERCSITDRPAASAESMT